MIRTGSQVRRTRLRLGLTQKQCAKKAKVSERTWRNYERQIRLKMQTRSLVEWTFEHLGNGRVK